VIWSVFTQQEGYIAPPIVLLLELFRE